MFASVPSAVLLGARGHRVAVEVHVGKGLPAFHLVGRPDDSIREARDRVRAAMCCSGFDLPDTRVTVNLAPPQHRKTGSALDLAIAVGVLIAGGEVPAEAARGLAFVGELGLDGSIRAVPGVAPMVGAIGECDVVVPIGNQVEAGLVALGEVRLIATLRELVDVLLARVPWPDHRVDGCEPEAPPPPDLAEVQGQLLGRTALEIAAAGGHHLLLVGPPGSGKTMLASRLPALLPPLERERALEATMVHSAAGQRLPAGGLVTRAPFRAPHHTSSMVSLVGGGSHTLRPGEISLAHCGVLFMDELAEFPAMVLDALRQPLEEGVVRVARANANASLPAEFLLVAAMNPCPCGGGPPGDCRCDEGALRRYARRVSGPLLDRFDLRVSVSRPAVDDLLVGRSGETTAAVAGRVAAARRLAVERQGGLNGVLRPAQLDEVAELEPGASVVLRREIELDRLTGRGYHRVRRVARTIADLRGASGTSVSEADVSVALEMRGALRRGTRGPLAA